LTSDLERIYYKAWIAGDKSVIPPTLRPFYSGLVKSRDMVAKELFKRLRESESAYEAYTIVKTLKEMQVPYVELEQAVTPRKLTRLIARQFSDILNVKFTTVPQLIEKSVFKHQLDRWLTQIQGVIDFTNFIAKQFGYFSTDILKELELNVQLPKGNKRLLMEYMRGVSEFVKEQTGMQVLFYTKFENLRDLYREFSGAIRLYVKDLETGQIERVNYRDIRFMDRRGKMLIAEIWDNVMDQVYRVAFVGTSPKTYIGKHTTATTKLPTMKFGNIRPDVWYLISQEVTQAVMESSKPKTVKQLLDVIVSKLSEMGFEAQALTAEEVAMLMGYKPKTKPEQQKIRMLGEFMTLGFLTQLTREGAPEGIEIPKEYAKRMFPHYLDKYLLTKYMKDISAWERELPVLGTPLSPYLDRRYYGRMALEIAPDRKLMELAFAISAKSTYEQLRTLLGPEFFEKLPKRYRDVFEKLEQFSPQALAMYDEKIVKRIKELQEINPLIKETIDQIESEIAAARSVKLLSTKVGPTKAMIDQVVQSISQLYSVTPQQAEQFIQKFYAAFDKYVEYLKEQYGRKEPEGIAKDIKDIVDSEVPKTEPTREPYLKDIVLYAINRLKLARKDQKIREQVLPFFEPVLQEMARALGPFATEQDLLDRQEFLFKVLSQTVTRIPATELRKEEYRDLIKKSEKLQEMFKKYTQELQDLRKLLDTAPELFIEFSDQDLDILIDLVNFGLKYYKSLEHLSLVKDIMNLSDIREIWTRTYESLQETEIGPEDINTFLPYLQNLIRITKTPQLFATEPGKFNWNLLREILMSRVGIIEKIRQIRGETVQLDEGELNQNTYSI